jgi:hypothetical protein
MLTLRYQCVTEIFLLGATIRILLGVLISDWDSLGGLRPSQHGRSGSHLGGDPAAGPAPTLPVGPCGRVSATASAHRGHLHSSSGPRGGSAQRGQQGQRGEHQCAELPFRVELTATLRGQLFTKGQFRTLSILGRASRAGSKCHNAGGAPPRPAFPDPGGPPRGIWLGVRLLYVYGQWWQFGCAELTDNSIGGERFRLWWSNQGKRAEGCGYDLVNPVAAKQ